MAELEKLQMLINGQWCAASDDAAFDCIDPSTGQPWARIPEATHADVNRAVEAALLVSASALPSLHGGPAMFRPPKSAFWF